MQFAVDPNALQEALDDVRGLISSKSTLDVLSNVLLEWSDDSLEIWATNLETTARSQCDIYADEGGRACLRGGQLYDIVRGLDAPEMDVEIEDNWWASLTAGDVDARIVGVHPDDYPSIPEMAAAGELEVPASTIAGLIGKVEHAISTDDARANLTGAHLELTDVDTLRLTSTDGHRLATCERDVSADLPGEGALREGVIVPREALGQLTTILDDGAVQIGLNDDGQLVFAYEGTTMVTNPVEGTFPDYTKVIPDDGAGDPAYIERETMTDRVKFVSMFASSKTNSIRLTLEDNELELYASDPDHGEGQRTVPVDYDGDEVKVRFNHRYLRDAIERVDSDTVELTSTDTVSPTLIEDPNDDEMLQVVMPMRL